jgi:5-methylcytosine-specific restriction protein B
LSTSGEHFAVPENVYIIGTMNTADRSIALVDHALRRRFSFIFMGPEYDILQQHLEKNHLPTDSLIRALKSINSAINDRNYELGISFFLADNENLKDTLPIIWAGEIEPYLEEYFFDQPDKVDEFRWNKLSKGILSDWKS